MDQLSRNEDLQAQLQAPSGTWSSSTRRTGWRAHYFGGKLEKTKRFQLGELLGAITRHLLLMTATPHAGKEEDFQLFLTLLDRDRFEGKYQTKVYTDRHQRAHAPHGQGRPAHLRGQAAVPRADRRDRPLELTALEQDLYEQVTAYVREGMNRADKLGGKRKNTVGFALTVLQRRLASSPEAIYARLERRSRAAGAQEAGDPRRHSVAEPETATASSVVEDFDDDELDAEEIEELEEELVDAATAAQTVEELDAETARTRRSDRVGRAGARRRHRPQVDRSCATILEDHALRDRQGRCAAQAHHLHRAPRHPRLPGAPDPRTARPARRREGHPRRRRRATPRRSPRSSPKPRLPDPARHRRRRRGPEPSGRAPDGQLRPAVEPQPHRAALRPHPPHRPGRGLPAVEPGRRQHPRRRRLHPLLAKIEEQRKAYGGKVFDVLGDAFTRDRRCGPADRGHPLRRRPRATRQNMEQVIDAEVADGSKSCSPSGPWPRET